MKIRTRFGKDGEVIHETKRRLRGEESSFAHDLFAFCPVCFLLGLNIPDVPSPKGSSANGEQA